MKLSYTILSILLLGMLFTTIAAKAQHPDRNRNDELLNLLIKKNVLSQKEADSLSTTLSLKEKKDKENQHYISFGSDAIQISGLVQTRYQGFAQDGVNSTFDLHRARLDVKGDINDNWSYQVYTEFAGTTKLLDAYTTYKIAAYLKFTAGQFKVPFSLESLFADSQLEFIDRAQVVDAFTGRAKDVIGNQNGRDIGIQVSGSFIKIDNRYLFDYTLGVFNGAGYNVTTDNNNRKDIAGRLTVHPLNNLSISADFYGGQGNYGVPAKNQTRNRGGFDTRYIYNRLSLTAEYDKGTDGIINRDGWYVQASYFIIAKKLQLTAKYDTYDPDKDIATDRSNWYIGGLNYLFNDRARFTIDYSYRREEIIQPKNNLLSLQLQLAF